MTLNEDDVQEVIAQATALAATVNRLNEDVIGQVVEISGNQKKIRRLVVWLTASFILDVILTIALGLGFVTIHGNTNDIGRATQQARANTCNLNLLLTQSAAGGSTTVDLYKGLALLLKNAKSPEGKAALIPIEKAITNTSNTTKVRRDFLVIAAKTARDLHCPRSFILK